MKAILLRSKKVARSVTTVLLLVLSLSVQAQVVKSMSITAEKKQITDFLNKKKGLITKTDNKESERFLEIELKRKQLYLKKDSLKQKGLICHDLIRISENKSKRSPSISSTATVISKTVTVTAGGLFSSLTEGERKSVNNLIVKGVIDARDFQIIRDTLPTLTVIDLSGVTIAAYTGLAGTDTTGITKTYAANAIPQYAFNNPVTGRVQAYTSILVPTSITTIGDWAFLGCQSLTSFVIPSKVTTIGKCAFEQCSGLATINFPASVKKIKAGAFYDTGLTNVTIPYTVDSIGQACFYRNSKLASATISSKYIGLSAFENCTILTSVTINNTVNKIDAFAFESCVSLRSITIPSSVMEVGLMAFEDCISLASADISAKTINDAAFQGCKNLSSLTLTNYVVNIGWFVGAFEHCDKLTSVTIPFSVKNMDFAFIDCKNLTSAIIYSTTTGAYTFSRDSALTSVTLMKGVWLIDQGTFHDCSSLSSVIIPPTVTEIYFDAFNGCSNLSSIAIPSSVTKIGGSAFLNCTSLSSITIPPSVTSIGDLFMDWDGGYAFAGCSNLALVHIPWSVTTLGNYSFAGSSGDVTVDDIPSAKFSSLDGVLFNKARTTLIHCPISKRGNYVIPSTVNFIDSAAFLFCRKLSSVTIPSSVTTIGESAFYGCDSLAAIYANAISPIGLVQSSRIFDYVDSTSCVLYVPKGSKPAYQVAAVWNKFTNIVEVTKDLELSTNAVNAPVDGGDSTITVTSNTSWTAKSDQQWLIISPSSGSGNGTIKLTALANTENARTATVTITPIDAFAQTIIVNQTVLPKTINITAGGLSKAFTTTERSLITELVITGTIDARDFKTMRDSMLVLSYLDLSGASVVGYTGIDGTYPDYDGSKIYPVNTIPESAFDNYYTGSKLSLKTVILPLSVTTIGSGAFEGCSGLSSIKLPIALTSIGSFAFEQCSGLISITIPNAVTSIGSSAFSGCSSLTSIYINSNPVDLSSSYDVFGSVKQSACTLYVPYKTKALFAVADKWRYFNIVENTQGFLLGASTAKLVATAGSTSVNVTANVTWTASSDQTWLTVSPGSATGNDTLTITAQANPTASIRTALVTISSAGIASQTITVTQIGSPKSITVTAGGLSSALTIAELNGIIELIITGTIDARDFKTMRDKMPLLTKLDLSATTILAYTGIEGTFGVTNNNYPAKTIPLYAFYSISTYKGKQTLTSVILPLTATSIGDYAFSNCSSLTSLTLPSSTATIGSYAFEYCIGLTSVIIPSSITTIGEQAFYSCTGLTSLILPSSITTIGRYAFSSCTSLKVIKVLSSVPVNLTASGVFSYVNVNTCILRIPIGSIDAYKAANQWKDFKCIVEGEYSSIKTINVSAGQLVSALTPTELFTIINLTVTGTIDARDFVVLRDSMINLSILDLSGVGVVAYIGTDGTYSTSNTTYPEMAMPQNAFCKQVGFGMIGKLNLISIIMPSSIISIGRSSFNGCSNLKSLTIPSSVNSIGINTFYNCTSLTTIDIPSSVNSIESGAFANCSGLTSISVNSNPIDLSSSSTVFGSVNKSTCTLYVPKGSMSAYQSAMQWKDFTNIIEMITTDLSINTFEKINLYPNPATDAFQISGIEGNVTLKLVDINGRSVLTKQVTNNESVSVSTLPKGLYIIKLITDEGTVERKVVKK